MRNPRTVAIALAACIGLSVFVAWLYEWPIGKALVLAPVIVIVFGAAAFLFVLWGKIVWESFRGRRGS